MDGSGAAAIISLPIYCCLWCFESPKTETVANSPQNHASNNCISRISTLIGLMIISLIFSCLGIFAITEFCSSTDSYNSIYKTGIAKHLKGIEYGLGGAIYVFPIIFFGMSIAFLVFTCGKREFQVLPAKKYVILNILKIICIALSLLLIALSLLYSILITIAINDIRYDGAANMILGYLTTLYYIISISLFAAERRLFVLVGTCITPGPYAIYDINYQPIVREKPADIIHPGLSDGQGQNVPIYSSNIYVQNVPNNQNIQNVYIQQNVPSGSSGDRMNMDYINEKRDINLNIKK